MRKGRNSPALSLSPNQDERNRDNQKYSRFTSAAQHPFTHQCSDFAVLPRGNSLDAAINKDFVMCYTAAIDLMAKFPELPALRRMVLLNLASRANGAGECYPSYDRIAVETGMSRRAVINAMNDLVKQGIVKKQASEDRTRGAKKPHHGANLYIIPAELVLHPWGMGPREDTKSSGERDALGSERDAPYMVHEVHGGGERDAPEIHKEIIKDYTPYNPPGGDAPKRGKAASKSGGKRKAKPIPEEWVENPESILDQEVNRRAVARNEIPEGDAKNETRKFVDWALQHDRRFVDWNAAWRTRCNNFWKFSGPRGGNGPGAAPRGFGQTASIADEVARRYRASQNSESFSNVQDGRTAPSPHPDQWGGLRLVGSSDA